jgi:choline-sulfatase
MQKLSKMTGVWNKIIIPAVWVVLLLLSAGCGQQSRQSQPNVLFLMADNHTAWYLGAAGHPIVRTPNLDRLAARGAWFSQAYTSYPVCTPARMSMLTGKYPAEIGIGNNSQSTNNIGLTIGDFFKNQGYATMVSGKMHFRGTDQHHGYDSRPIYDFDHSGWFTDGVEGTHVPFDWLTADSDIDNMHNRRPDSAKPYSGRLDKMLSYQITRRGLPALESNEPFLVMFSYLKPHWPWQPPTEFWDIYAGKGDLPAVGYDMPMDWRDYPLSPRTTDDWDQLTDEELRTARAAYYALISYMDDQLGVVLDKLEAEGKLDNTIIIYTSDHGEMAGERGVWNKHNYFEASVRIPLIISWPEKIPAGIEIDETVSLIDIFPTLADLAGYQIPEGLTGQSLVPLMQGNAENLRGYAAAGFGSKRMLRQGRLKLILNDKYHSPVLFDLQADPNELKNLAHDPTYWEALQDMTDIVTGLW